MSCVFGTSTVHTNLSPDLDDGQDIPHPTVLYSVYTYIYINIS